MLSSETDSLRSWRFVGRFVSLLTSGSGCWPQCKVKNEKKRLPFLVIFYINLSRIYGKLVKIQKVTIKECLVGDSWFGLVLTYFDSSRWHMHATTHATWTQIVRAKMTLLDAIFGGGNKSSSRSLARFCHRKHEKSTARSDALVKNFELDL